MLFISDDDGACFHFRLSLEISQLQYRLQCDQVALPSRFQNQTRLIVPHLYVYLHSSSDKFDQYFWN